MACDDLLLVFIYPICRFMELKQLSRISFVETVLENKAAANRLNSGLLQTRISNHVAGSFLAAALCAMPHPTNMC